MSGYSYITLSQALAQLSTTLDDPSNVRWSQAELTLYIQEALRTWQSLTGYWRDRFQFNLSSGANFYDLTQQAGSLIAFNLKDSDLLSVMLYHLIEPQISGGSYVGTSMFSVADFTDALQNRRNQFLEEAGMVTTLSAVPWPAPPTPRLALSDSVIDIRRAAWYSTPSAQWSTLWRSSEFGAAAFSPGWGQSPVDPPSEYSIAVEPPVTVGLIPPPLNPGKIQLLTVNAGGALAPLTGVLLGVPDNLAWVVKWGALADLLAKEGTAHDLERAKYCEQRWREGIAIARIHPSVVNCFLGGVQTMVNALDSFDAFNANWQNDTPGAPQSVALASWNMLAVDPAPDAGGPYSCAVDVARNAPVPSAGGDYLQLGREELGAVLGYAQHLADFKEGGNEFLGTSGLYDDMLRLAGVYNERLKAAVSFEEPMADRATRDESLVPRREPVEQSAGG
jgi:hypothetical protein